MKKIAIFASGSGTNAEAIMRLFEDSPAARSVAEVALILSNKADAYVLQRAAAHNVPTVCFTGAQLRSQPDVVLHKLQQYNIDFIVLAGFMLLVPHEIVTAYGGRIVNIHPALLPLYGGRGMYGSHVHQAVIADGAKVSGITIHFVNESYDKGDVILQAQCDVARDDTADTLAQKIHALEHEYYPKTILDTINKL